MGWFLKLKLHAKIIVGFLVVVAITGIIGYIDVLNIDRIGAIYAVILLTACAAIIAALAAFCLSAMIVKPLRKMKDAADRIASGDTDTKLNINAGDEIGELAASINKIIQNTKEQAEVARKISDGDLNVDVCIKSDNDLLGRELSNMLGYMKMFAGETNRLITAVEEGRLDDRADSTRFKGGWEKLVGEINSLVDEFTDPIKIAENCIEQISEGIIPEKITSSAKGDFKKIYDDINGLVETMDELRTKVSMQTDAITGGILDEASVDIGSLDGEWGKLLESINVMHTSIAEPVIAISAQIQALADGQKLEQITNTYPGEYGRMIDSINSIIEVFNSLIENITMISDGVVQGDLDSRADADSFKGQYNEIVQGMNNIVDAIDYPVNDITMVMRQITVNGVLAETSGDVYEGMFKIITDSVNKCSQQLKTIISEISDRLSHIAGGDFNVEYLREYKGDFAQISGSINEIIKSLNEDYGKLNAAAKEVASGAKQVSEASMSLSQGSTEQASSIEEVTASVAEVASEIKKNAENARQANDLSQTAVENASKGREQMKVMLEAMKDINESSDSISKIIKVIDDIAFQTNILALNAAVEAARAGQHGKGFAVVADEVRNLAAKSANAAKETASLIEDSVKKTSAGTKIANETAEKLNSIVENVTGSAKIISGIASSSEEQAAGITQVDVAMEQISKVTQNNTATSEEAASASEELSSQSQKLEELVGRIKLKQESGDEGGIEGLDPEIIQKIMEMVEKDNRVSEDDKEPYSEAEQEAAPAAAADEDVPDIDIKLDDSEFGKY